jgi:hypothetical protein
MGDIFPGSPDSLRSSPLLYGPVSPEGKAPSLLFKALSEHKGRAN